MEHTVRAALGQKRLLLLFCCLSFMVTSQTQGDLNVEHIPENTYRGELLAYPGAFAFLLHRPHIIIVSDAQLEALANPDAPIDLSLTYDKREETLRQICENARAGGHRTLILAFDYFFSQYRDDGQKTPRKLTPDRPAAIEIIGTIGRFVKEYGLGLELSLLSPLEIGPGYYEETGESGRWMHFRKGLRDPKTGAYSVQLWRQCRWANNKGVIDVEDAGVRVFAFREIPVHGTPYRTVLPDDIVEITDTASVELYDGLRSRCGDYEAVRVRIHGTGKGDGRDRVLVVQQYRTPEMDYFSDSALPYLKSLGDRYIDAGVKLNGLYSDEMHIQQSWNYFGHHDHGQFAVRYVSPGFEKKFAALYGDQYNDLAKYMVYFVCGQEDNANDVAALEDIMHVFGPTPESIRRTALFRANYYRLLQNGVVDLFAEAKRYLEKRIGYRLETRAHATWAESPTIDKWNVERQHHPPHQYEYTPNFQWSCTVHQASSACYDYFKWNDFLTGGGNDHAEGGWLDRNYFGAALACSTGILNDVPYAYAAHWGMPRAIFEKRMAIVNTFGAAGEPFYGIVQDMEHRDVAVLMLYPLDLTAINERFGSWMVQYGYANMITQEQLLKYGEVRSGAIHVKGRKFTTLVALFEPFPEPTLLEMMEQLVVQGGRVVWSGPPPLIFRNGETALESWGRLAGASYVPTPEDGLIVPGRRVVFSGVLAGIPDMTILTDLLVDRVYPLLPQSDGDVVAQINDRVVGVHHRLGEGSFTALGFRPRDDQSQSLGYETRFWFDILHTLGAYAPSNRFGEVNDNTEYLSRTTPYLCCRFPNGALAIAPHLTSVVEQWHGGFARNEEEDSALLQKISLPRGTITLTDFCIHGLNVSYDGLHSVTFRIDEEGNLLAFAGRHTNEIVINGKRNTFADQKMPLIAWAPVREDRRVPGGAILTLFYVGEGNLRIPIPYLKGNAAVFAEGTTPGSRGDILHSTSGNGELLISAVPQYSHRWIYVVPES